MTPLLAQECSNSVTPWPVEWLTLMHLHDCIVYFHCGPGNLQVLRNSSSRETETLSGITGGSTEGSSKVQDSSRWRKKWNVMCHTLI